MKTINAIVLLLLILPFYSCETGDTDAESQEHTTADLIHEVRQSDKLYTTEYVVRKIVTYDDIIKIKGKVFSQSFDVTLPQGKRKVLIPMEANVKAYIDFSGFNESNVRVGADSTITVTLPDPKVVLTSTRIDHSGIISYVDFGRSRFSQGELAEFEQQGRDAIIKTIPNLNIVADARADAYNLLLPLVESLGYDRDKITIEFRKDFTVADYVNDLIINIKD